jgi:peptidoglycan/xylan/chitin deacetylase (PgdA/CDA1 family)
MNPPVPGFWRAAWRRRVAAGLAALALCTAAACGDPTESAAGHKSRPGASATASASTSASAPSGPYASRIPSFPARPAAVKATFPVGALAPVVSRIPTAQPVAFITIDDGQVRRPEATALLKAAGVPTSLFLISSVAAADPGYFAGLQKEGAVIESHTLTHTSLRGLSYARQKQEICGSTDRLGQLFGRRPVLFRPPYGAYDTTTRRAAHDCGMKAVLLWKEATNGGHVFYQTPFHKVHAGDLILMHFRPAFVDDFLAVLHALHESGLTPALLEDYIS